MSESPEITLEARVNQQIIAAMKARESERVTTLRLIKTALKNKEIDKREPLTPQESEQILASMIKQRRDSIDQFTKGNRPELAEKEAAEIVLIEEFLPKALDAEALRGLIEVVIEEFARDKGATPTPKDMGLIIKAAQAKIQSDGLRAEGRLVSETVKTLLASA